MSEGEPVTTIQLHDLEKEGVLEDLIAQGRAPGSFVRAFTSPAGDKDKLFNHLVNGTPVQRISEEVVFCFVPPEGIKPKDKALGSASWGYEVLTPDGTSRGYAKMYEMTPSPS